MNMKKGQVVVHFEQRNKGTYRCERSLMQMSYPPWSLNSGLQSLGSGAGWAGSRGLGMVRERLGEGLGRG